MGCLEHSSSSSSSSGSGGEKKLAAASTAAAKAETPPPELAEEVAALSEKLALEMAEIFSPKELHIMALEHLHAYSEERRGRLQTVRTVLAILRRSTQRMAPLRRAKFLEAALRPALNATKRMAAAARATGNALPDPRKHQESNSDFDDDGNDDGGSTDAMLPPPPPPPPTAEHGMPSRAVYVAAALAAETAMDFVGPLVEQAYTERALLSRAPMVAAAAAAAAGHGEDGQLRTIAVATDARSTANCPTRSREAASASDLSLAAYLGLALSALELAAETSACTAAAAAVDSASTAPASSAARSADSVVDGVATSRAQQGFEDKAPAVAALAKAEERLVGLIIGGPVDFLDLQFVLLHGCRLSHADRAQRRRLREDDGEETGRERAGLSSPGCVAGLVGVGEAAVSGALPWALGGVSSLAYVVACTPKLREKWLPLVWSRRTERRLFLPHAEVLMRNKSKRIASKGLKLACFVAERLGGFPDHTGAFAFDWEPEDRDQDPDLDGGGGGGGGGGGDAWSGGQEGEEMGAAAAASGSGSGGGSGINSCDSGERSRSSPRRKQSSSDPHHLDLAAFLQVLVDVMVTCPLPSLRARGHAAMSAFLGAASEAGRFRVLKRLVERCPWPNATGLLLDAFRREIDRALRPYRPCPGGREEEEEQQHGQHKTEEKKEEGRQQQQHKQQHQQSSSEAVAAVSSSSSPFASRLAGDFVSDQLRRACRRGPPASLMVDMDSRTGGLTLARYAHALDAAGGEGGGAAGGVGGRLKLREPQKLRENRLLVQDLLDELRGAAVTADSARPEHFRLFILEDAAQQCLQELQR
ncbi:unnamed protein product [Pylaiella littoralis]